MKDPAFLFYSDNFLSGTMFFTDEQTGKYIRLLCAQHLTGHLEEKHMIFICKGHDEDIWKKFTKDDDGKFYNERLEIEITKRKNYSESRSNNKKGKIKKTKKISKSYDKHMGNGNEDGNIDDLELQENGIFECFWNDYDKKVGDKEKIKAKFLKLPTKEQMEIFNHIPKYKESQPNKKYRKNPETYLNNKSWLDEIITDEQPIINKSPQKTIPDKVYEKA